MRRKLKVLLSAVVVLTLVLSSFSSVFAERGKSESKGKSQLAKIQQLQKKENKINNSSKNLFKDIGSDFWAYQAITDLANLGIIKGYSDNTFKPNESVTRTQFAIMLTRALKLTATDNTQKFADVPATAWYFKEVAASQNYLTGFQTSNGTLYFYGDKNAVREDMAVALVKALNLAVISDNGQLQQVYSDYNEISAKLRDYINTAYKDGIMMGSDGKFAPQGTLTRASAATLLMRALQKAEKVPPQDDGEKVVIGNTNTVNTDATLSNLTVNGVALTGFVPSTLTYNVVLPAGTTLVPTVVATVNDTGKATVNVTQATGLPGITTAIVTAQDGKTQKLYTINFSLPVIEKSTDATLSNLTVNGAMVTGFNSSTQTYNVVLPAGTTLVPAVAATVNDTGKATVTVTQAAALPGTATAIVTAQDGKTQKLYTINFTVAVIVKNTDATLSGLAVNGITVAGFNPNTLTYNIELPKGTTSIPAVTATVNDIGKATGILTQAAALPGFASVVVTAEDGVTKKAYIINFTVAA